MPLTWPRIQLLGSCFGHIGSTLNPAASAPEPGESPLEPRTSGDLEAQAPRARAQPRIESFEGIGASVPPVYQIRDVPSQERTTGTRVPRVGSMARFSLPRPRMDQLVAETRYALRRIFESPGVSAVVALTLALGIGANSAIFSVVDAVLL